MYELFKPRVLRLSKGNIVTCPTGGHAYATDDEINQLKLRKISKEFYYRLCKAGVAVSNANRQEVICAVGQRVKGGYPELHEVELAGRGGETMTSETARKVGDFISSIPGREVTLWLKGADALKNIRAAKILVKINKRVRLRVDSSLENLDQKQVEFLKEHKPALFVQIKPSINPKRLPRIVGLSKLTARPKLLVARLRGLGIYRIKLQLDPGSCFSYWKALIEALQGQGIVELYTLEMYRRAVLGKPEQPCGAVSRRLAYDASGNIYPCSKAMLQRIELFRLGDVSQKFTDFACSGSVQGMLRYARSPLCSRCALSSFCTACPVDCYVAHGAPTLPKGLWSCRLSKAQYAQVFEWEYQSPKMSHMLKAWNKTKDL
jgi:radical SAM protein with 4Fe4S-binding SPASM domain